MTLGSNIKAAREAAGLSQTELARRIGSDQKQVYRYETDDQDMSFKRFLKIAEALGVSPEDLIKNLKIL